MALELQHNNSNYYPQNTPLNGDQRAAVEASHDWQARVVGANADAQVAVQHKADNKAKRALERRWRFLARDTEPVPAALNCDVAFVRDAAELRWLEEFNALLADPARLAKV